MPMNADNAQIRDKYVLLFGLSPNEHWHISVRGYYVSVRGGYVSVQRTQSVFMAPTVSVHGPRGQCS